MKNVFFAMMLLCAPVFSSDEPQPKVAPVPQNVFKLVSVDGAQRCRGTAFFVSDDLLLTAAHNLRDAATTRYILRNGKQVAISIVKVDFKLDVAVIRCAEKNPTHYTLAVHGGTTVIGFLGHDTTATITTSSLAQLLTKNKCLEGMSGCPVVNEAGNVVGMGIRRDSNDMETWSSSCYAVPSDVMLEFMQGVK